MADDQPDVSSLSAEQADSHRLILQLLGTAVADRYVDFCRLASGTLPLIVSRPLAGHALRELDSLVRHVLATPMEARAADNPDEARRRRDARTRLKELSFDEPALQRAEKALKPTFSHKRQIQQIVTRLGLTADGDVAKLWIKLNEAYGRVHERSFHVSLQVDETFRAEFARPFDTVIRALMVQLEGRYAALMLRVKEIAAMPPEKGVRLFANEIPGAFQLQAYFYKNLPSEGWLPHLASQGLLVEPLPEPHGGNAPRLWGWPVGRYLTRMASSEDANARDQVVQAIRAVADSAHPEVHRLSMEAIEALPASEGAALIDVLEGWVSPSTDLFTPAPHKIIAKWAQAGEMAAALRMVRLVFQLFDRDGQTAAHFDATMYEHYLREAIEVLSKTQPLAAVPELCALLLESSRMDRRLSQLDEADYSYYSVDTFEPGSTHSHDLLGALVIALARVSAAAVRANAADLRAVHDQLAPHPARIFVRMSLHCLALAPASAPDLAAAYLTNVNLIDGDWCRQEYAALARAWFVHLTPAEQSGIIAYIDAIPDSHRETFHSWFERQEKRPPSAEDERKYRETTFRDVVWAWRSALPADRLAAVEKTAVEFGDPDAWTARFFERAESPMSRTAMLEQDAERTAAFLVSWQPSRQEETAGALANELREAVATRPDLFSAAAASFAPARSLFLRHFLDGLRRAPEGVAIDWGPCLELVSAVLKRSKTPGIDQPRVAGDDPDWSWAIKEAVSWLEAGLMRGAKGITFAHYAAVRSLVLELAGRAMLEPVPSAKELSRDGHPYFSAQQTVIGSGVELVILFLFWASKDPANEIGEAPREALARDSEMRALLETALNHTGTAGWSARAVLGRYLNWLFHFGEAWVRSQVPTLFPKDDTALRRATWIAHIQSDQQPAPGLMEELSELYAEHIAVVGGDDEAFGGDNSRNRIAEYVIILYLWEKLPEELLQEFWKKAPPSILRHAMWFVGRYLVSDNPLHERARTYWDRRLERARAASDKGRYKKELGVLGMWFLWNIDTDWLFSQLMLLLNAGFAPNDGISIIDELAEHIPARTDAIVEIVRALVRDPEIQPWMFGVQEQSLRIILAAGKANS